MSNYVDQKESLTEKVIPLFWLVAFLSLLRRTTDLGVQPQISELSPVEWDDL